MTKKLIDITRLGEYNDLIKNYIQGKVDGVNSKIGTVPSKVGEQNVADLVDYITKTVEAVNASAGDLEARVSANEEAIGHAKGTGVDATGLYLHVDNAAAAAIAQVVAGADASFDTLKEIEQWINNNIDGAESMKTAIKVLQGTDGSNQTKDSNSIPGVKLYIDSLVSGKNVDAAAADGELLFTASAASNKVTVASTEKLKDAVARAEASVQNVSKGTCVENYVTLTVNNATKDVKASISDAALATKINGMYTDIQGTPSETVASIDAKVAELQVCSAAEIAALFN